MILHKAQKLGLGALVLLMGASLLAMRPHQASNPADPKVAVAHLKLASLSTAARRDVDYRLLDAQLRSEFAQLLTTTMNDADANSNLMQQRQLFSKRCEIVGIFRNFPRQFYDKRLPLEALDVGQRFAKEIKT